MLVLRYKRNKKIKKYPSKLPSVTLRLCKGCDDGNYTEIIKPLYSHPPRKVQGGKKIKGEIDITKPKSMFIPLLGFGKKVLAKFYGPGDQLVNPVVFESKNGIIEPVVFLKHVYYGPHGETDYGMSIKLNVIEANYTPAETGFNTRILGANKALKTDDLEYEEAIAKTKKK